MWMNYHSDDRFRYKCEVVDINVLQVHGITCLMVTNLIIEKSPAEKCN